MERKTDLNRRQFCIAGAAAAGLAATGGLGLLARQQAHAVYLRPPGAESEGALLAKCDRCERCVQACPYGLVQPRPLSLDFPTVGTPEVVYKSGYCDFCMKCVEACPTGALSLDAPSAHDIGVARVQLVAGREGHLRGQPRERGGGPAWRAFDAAVRAGAQRARRQRRRRP